jgi:hypothetical protein
MAEDNTGFLVNARLIYFSLEYLFLSWLCCLKKI